MSSFLKPNNKKRSRRINKSYVQLVIELENVVVFSVFQNFKNKFSQIYPVFGNGLC